MFSSSEKLLSRSLLVQPLLSRRPAPLRVVVVLWAAFMAEVAGAVDLVPLLLAD
jgi:hypothetical protein